MIDEPRDVDPFDEEEPDAPPPATWAGRRGRDDDGAVEDDPEFAGDDAEEGVGLTEEFDRVEQRLREELHGEDTERYDELEVPPTEFEFEEDELEEEYEDELGAEPEGTYAEDDFGDEFEEDYEESYEEADEEELGEEHEPGEEEHEPEAEAVEEDEPEVPGDTEEAEAVAEAAVAAAPSDETVEVDTLALADEEAAREAAHAALAARAAERAGGAGAASAVAAPPPEAPAEPEAEPELPVDPPPEPPEVGPPPKRRLWLRFVAGSFVAIAAMAAATAVSALVYLDGVASGIGDDPILRKVGETLPPAGGGDPQTFLIMGSDKRSTVPGDPGRSDTTMLLRIDPSQNAIRLLSLPRDLRVEIPVEKGVEVTEKLNAAYTYGGPPLTLRTVQRLFPDIEINHIVNVDFKGFYDAVNAIGCVYVDVDRHYYNPVGGEYDDIDIEAGYNKLCGYRALDYVRYRHNDNDLVRGTRQQDFLREARQRIPPRKLFEDRDELLDIFKKHTTSDVHDPITLLGILKTLLGARNANVRQIPFQSSSIDNYVEATEDQLKDMADQFLGEDEAEDPADKGSGQKSKKKKKKKKDKEPAEPQEPVLEDATGLTIPFAQQFAEYMRKKRARLPIYFPTRQLPGSRVLEESRSYGVPDFDDKHIFRGYKFVMQIRDTGGFFSYYGLTGVDWQNPPILNNPSETRVIDGREYLLFWDGDRLRQVGWKTKKGSYWVTNTLTRRLSEQEMLAIATSAEKLG